VRELIVNEGHARVLVVEDNLLIAMEVESLLRRCGCDVVGPVGSVDEALGAVREAGLAGAVLDINLGVEHSWAVADFLDERGLPFILVSGYGEGAVPDRHKTRPLLSKPLSLDTLGKALREIGAIPAT
jgi:CheY-like chemotaxis protein